MDGLKVRERDEVVPIAHVQANEAVHPLDALSSCTQVTRRMEGHYRLVRRSAWIRSAICWIIVPLGMNSGRLFEGRTSSSRVVTVPPSP